MTTSITAERVVGLGGTTGCLLAGFVEQKSLNDEATLKKTLAEFRDGLGG